MANQGGVNQFQGFQPEAPYGQIKRLQQLVQQAPLPPNSAITAPDRAKDSATKPAPAPNTGTPAPEPPTISQPVEEPYPATLARITSELPGADGTHPNITWLAQQAATEANG